MVGADGGRGESFGKATGVQLPTRAARLKNIRACEQVVNS
jgi:hypothetical protein